nr:rhomboid family intramembrane serine protease [Polymorphobacter sp.]
MKPFKPPTPIATNALMGVCAVVQAAVLVGGSDFGQSLHVTAGLIPARISAALAGHVPLVPAMATFVTHIFLHAGLLHLGLNLLFLAWVGRYVEWVTGRWQMVTLFLAGGIAGGVLQVLVDPQSNAIIIGASGAIAAVFGAYAVLFARSRATACSILGITISGETLTALWYAAAWIGLQLLTGLVFNAGGASQIAIWTHIGGFVTGLLVARVWGRGPQPS